MCVYMYWGRRGIDKMLDSFDSSRQGSTHGDETNEPELVKIITFHERTLRHQKDQRLGHLCLTHTHWVKLTAMSF